MKYYNTSKTKKYWEIVLGPWLLHLIGFYVANPDKFVENFLHTEKLYSKEQHFKLAPYSWDDFVLNIENGSYSQLINSDVEPKNKMLIYDPNKFETTSSPIKGNSFLSNQLIMSFLKVKILTFEAIGFAVKLWLRGGKKVLTVADQNVISEKQLKEKPALKKTKLVFFPRYNIYSLTKRLFSLTKYKPINSELREKLHEHLSLNSNCSSSETVLLNKLICLTVPVFNLEYFHFLRRCLWPFKSRIPKNIILSNTQYFNEQIKILSAEWNNLGSKIFISQHGAGYFLFKGYTYETHDSSIADVFLTWGYENKSKNQIKFPSITLAKFLTGPLPSSKTGKHNFIFACNFYSEVCHDHMHIQKIDSQIISAARERFARNLRDEQKQQIFIRPYPIKSGSSNICHTPEFDKNTFNFMNDGGLFDNVNSQTVIIVEGISTAFFEALAKDIPVVLFFPHINLIPLSKNGEKFFDLLLSHNMIFVNEHDLTSFLDRDVIKWWSSKKITEAKKYLRNHYLYTSTDWDLELTDLINR